MSEFQPITATEPAQGQIVNTCIDANTKAQRNEALLYRQGGLWFAADGYMYVYYRPTHFHPIPEDKRTNTPVLLPHSARVAYDALKSARSRCENAHLTTTRNGIQAAEDELAAAEADFESELSGLISATPRAAEPVAGAVCPKCGGSGCLTDGVKLPSNAVPKCPECNGRGYVKPVAGDWTPEPWHLGTRKGYNACNIMAYNGGDDEHCDQSICSVYGIPLHTSVDDLSEVKTHRLHNGLANALRIIQCVNACANLADPGQEIAGLRAERDRLKALIERSGLIEVDGVKCDPEDVKPTLIAAGKILVPKDSLAKEEQRTKDLLAHAATARAKAAAEQERDKLRRALEAASRLMDMLPSRDFWNGADSANFFDGSHGKLLREKFDDAWQKAEAALAKKGAA